MDHTGDPLAVQRGFARDDTARAALLYWQAFGAKLGRVLGPRDRALGFVSEVMNPDFALSIYGADGTLLGLAGFKTETGALVDGGWAELRRHYGLLGGLWRAPLLALLERKMRPGELLMDGIFVAEEARGQGLGGALLAAIKSEATARGATSVRLDVIDTNPRARALYERVGFRAVRTEQIGPLRALFGFSSATEMIWSVEAP